MIAKETFASSSAAGGLKMSVHGLVYEMTVKAAKEAALGAGANIKMITSGILDEYQIEEIKATPLNIIMISGGVDYGERKTSIENAKKIAELKLNIPIIYAGNIQNQNIVKKYLRIITKEGFYIYQKTYIQKLIIYKLMKLERLFKKYLKNILFMPLGWKE